MNFMDTAKSHQEPVPKLPANLDNFGYLQDIMADMASYEIFGFDQFFISDNPGFMLRMGP